MNNSSSGRVNSLSLIHIFHVLDEANRCLGCKKPMCQEGCPIHTNIPEVIRLVCLEQTDHLGDVGVDGAALLTQRLFAAEAAVGFVQNMKSVSYTHLDVYKRQLDNWHVPASAGLWTAGRGAGRPR